jgi:glycosyltransferase involved in cell wall biosynthesis
MVSNPVRVLLFSTLYPNTAQPNHGIFVENRLCHTVAQGGVEAVILAPVPFFPFSHAAFGRYGVYARVPESESRHGMAVLHPRYLVFPKMSDFTPWFLYRSALAAVRRLQSAGQSFDVIDAHYFYPDGVVAAMLGRALRIPVIITGRGSDLTLIARYPLAGRRIRWAISEASVVVAVCEDLRRRLLGMGADARHSVTLRNGVDMDNFSRGDRAAARAALGLKRFTLLSVGSLIRRKGHDIAIRALADLPDCDLLIAGSGPLRSELQHLATRVGVADRVRYLGEVRHAALSDIYRAADVMVLLSDREGWANVLLEAMACGTPVVATDVNGTSEVVRAPEAGVLMRARTPAALVDALGLLRRNMPDPAATSAYARRFDWTPTAQANKSLLISTANAGYAGRHSPRLLDGVWPYLALDAGVNIPQP